MIAAGVVLLTLATAPGPQWTRVDVRGAVRVDDVDVAFVNHSHKTAVSGRNVGTFSFELSRKGGAPTKLRVDGRYDDLFGEVAVDGALVLLRAVTYGTFEARVIAPAPAPLEFEACRALLAAEVVRRRLPEPKDGARSFTEANGIVTMHNPAWRGHCGVYTRQVQFFSGPFARDEGVETDVLAQTSTRVGDTFVTFFGANPKHDDDDQKPTLVYELQLERNGETASILFTEQLHREHWSERDVLGQALGLRASDGDELHVRLIHKVARAPLTMEACAALIAEEVKKSKHKVLEPESTSTRDGVVTVKTAEWTARCGAHSGRVLVEGQARPSLRAQ